MRSRGIPVVVLVSFLAATSCSRPADADPRAYEVDYLITPAPGGADDIRNLWPQPYTASIWNARYRKYFHTETQLPPEAEGGSQ